MTFELRPFQTRAADQIARRHRALAGDPRRPLEYAGWATPFYQALSGLTGSGKTPVLADAVSQIRHQVGAAPVVLWFAKSKAVVEQTIANFTPGGKYESLLPDFEVVPLAEVTPARVWDAGQALLAVATVGSFNQKGKGDGTLKVHRADNDDRGNTPLWTLLTERRVPNAAGDAAASPRPRRPLVIVYDEGHNLSDQQTDLLLELEPDVVLVASATLRTPGRLGRVIARLKDAGWSDAAVDDDVQAQSPVHHRALVTTMRSDHAVAEGLVKREVVLGGYATLTEIALADMLAEFRDTDRRARELEAGFLPKAIYVCQTNVNAEDGTADNPNRPFRERQAPPIVIWRYLVDQAKVDPATIAVYCDLKLDRKHHPPPRDFHLFSGGEDDFAAFQAGGYRHIIFNLALQEGWDDPACAFAYIDKSMASPLQIEQVVGRVLRQPGAAHYADPALNRANFYIRVDGKQQFPKILETVRKRIAAERPDLRIEAFADGRERVRAQLAPKLQLVVPHIHVDAEAADEPLEEVLAGLHDYAGESANVRGPGQVTLARQRVGDGSRASVEVTARDHANRVVARWLMRRTMAALCPRAAGAVDWSDRRFEARVEVTSPAAQHLREMAERLVDVFLAHSELAFETVNPYRVPGLLVNPDRMVPFVNALHDGYSDLRPTELAFAEALDATGLPWARNPANGGYAIPLLEKGDTQDFYPDFLVWQAGAGAQDGCVYALDPKGEHLIQRDAGRKLLAIRDEKGRQRVLVRLVTPGRWQSDPIKPLGPGGYSVWRITKSSQLRCTHHPDVASAVRKCLDLPTGAAAGAPTAAARSR